VSNGFPGTVPSFDQEQEIDDYYTTGRLGLSYDFTDQTTGFLSYAHGYAAGGYEKLLIGSANGDTAEPFRPATNDAIELGIKHRSADGRFSGNASVFYNRVKDGQIFDFAFNGPSVEYFFTNQDYNTWGLELEGRFAVTPDLDIWGSVAWLDSELVNVSSDTSTGAEDGNQVPLAPELTANLGVNYRIDGERLGIGGEVILGGEWTYVSERTADPANSWDIPSYSLVNATAAWSRDNYSFYIFGNNLTDERPIYFAAEYTPDIHAVSVGQGRVIGAGMSIQF
ncbi:MAG: TonB-dependent receptor, partial [Pseudomonadota bacterium]